MSLRKIKFGDKEVNKKEFKKKKNVKIVFLGRLKC